MECSWNDGGKTQYYYVILDQLQGHSGELVQAPELHIRGPLTEMVPRRFLNWRKVFRKVESERMLTRKVWDHTINLKETFKP